MKMAFINFVLFGGFMLLTYNQSPVFAQTIEPTEKILRTPVEFDVYYGSSSSENPADDGFRIVSVRRVYFLFKPFDSNFKKRKDFVEIELYAKTLPPVVSMPNTVQIGDKVVSLSGGCGRKRNCLSILLTLEEFESIKDNSIIHIYNGFNPSPDALKEMYKSGEPKEIRGVKFGRLNKKAADKFPPVKRGTNQ